MSDKTKIEWTDATWNVINGCTLVDDGCKNCYAATLAGTRLKNHPSRAGLTKRNAAGGYQFNGQVRFIESELTKPLHWRKPRMVFVCAHGDLFHEDVPDEWIDRVFAVMAGNQRHTFQCLSKRPERMRAYLSDTETVASIAALVYLARHGQRDNSTEERAIPGGPGRDDLADREAARSWRDAGRRLLSGRDHLAVHAGSSGVSNKGRLPAGLRHDQPDEDHDIGAQAGVGGDERPDPGWHDDQPQGRCEDEQSAGELGVGDDERAAPPRAGCSVGSATSPYRLETPEDDANGGGRSGNPAQTSERRARDRHSRGLLHEAEGNQRNLHGQDLDAHLVWPLPNIWLGTSVSDQTSADKRIPDLLATPAAVRFVSAEPLLGAVDLTGWFYGADIPCAACPKDVDCECGWQIWRDLPDSIAPGSLDWVIVGGESGKNARPMHPDWARSLRDQCEGAGVAFFFKQWGEWVQADHTVCPDSYMGTNKAIWLGWDGNQAKPSHHGLENPIGVIRVGKSRAGRLFDGREWNQMPGDV